MIVQILSHGGQLLGLTDTGEVKVWNTSTNDWVNL